VAWKLSLPGGSPLATPAFAQGKLYLGGGFGSFQFYCIDAESGKIVWEYKTTDDGPTAAVVDDDCVVFNTESCTIYTLDLATGKPRWSRWLGDPLLSQPAVADGKVYMAYPGKDGSHHLGCMRLQDGRELWDSPIAGDAMAAPVIAAESVFLTSFDGTVYRYDAASGRLVWSERRGATSPPWIWGDSVLLSQGREQGGEGPVRTANVFAGKSEAQVVFSGTSPAAPPKVLPQTERAALYLDPREQRGTGGIVLSSSHNESADAEAYHQLKGDSAVGFAAVPAAAKLESAEKNVGVKTVCGAWAYQGSRPSVAAGRSYAAMGDVLFCHDLRRGSILWERSFKQAKPMEGMRFLTPPSLANGKVFLSTAQGDVLCLSGEGKVLWSVNVGRPMAFQPCVMKGRVFVGTNGGEVIAIETGDAKDDGWPMWGGSPAHNGPK
jgi:Ca-activated chloride channel family protein